MTVAGKIVKAVGLDNKVSAYLCHKEEMRRYKRRLAFYRQFIYPGCLCFDIGANIGNRTQPFQELGANVIAIEPQKEIYQVLVNNFARTNKVRTLNYAVGANPGIAKMRICATHTMSSLSPEWINIAQHSQRFNQYQWTDRYEDVPITTLDKLIARYGTPDFCKIDTEGYEYEVIKGLSSPLPCLSFEFNTENRSVPAKCLERLAYIGEYEFNYSLSESMQWEGNWVNAWDMKNILETMPDEKDFGDVYARIKL